MKHFFQIIAVAAMVLTVTGCKSRHKNMDNPFFEEWTTPLGTPPFDQITASDFAPAIDRGMSLENAEIDAIAGRSDEPTFANTVLAYDRAGAKLREITNVFDMLCSAQSTPELRAVQEKVAPLLAAHYDAIRMNEKLFGRLKSIYDDRTELRLDSLQMRLVEKTYRDFVRAGAALSEPQKASLKRINEQLSTDGVRFSNNLLAANNAYQLFLTAEQLDGLPSSVRDAAADAAKAAGKEGQYLFTLHKPSMLPFLTYSTRRDLREKLYKAYLARCNGGQYDNCALINDMIRLRTEKAHLLGYRSYADYVISDQMAGTTDKAYALLNQIWTPALKKAKEELEEMQPLFAQDFPQATFASWDWWYYAERIRRQNYAFNEDNVRQYFELTNVQQGVFTLANRLYGITFRPVAVPLYNDDCSAFEVLDTNNTPLGVLYFDFFTRESKSQGAWCGYFREQSFRNGHRVPPIVGIVCNFQHPTAGSPTLLSIDDTQTIFHEFGHALHALFANVHYHGLANVEGDFVELPSQIMENWSMEPDMLRLYAVHFRSGEIIPQYLINSIRNARFFNKGFETTELTAAALTDLDIHSQAAYQKMDVPRFEREALSRRGLIPQIEPRYHYPYFSHIFGGGYSAGYYFYLWAEVLDKDAFEAFRTNKDIFNRRLAEQFRHKILQRGGEADGMVMYRSFRGADPDRMPMLRARGLVKDPAADSLAMQQQHPLSEPAIEMF